MSVTSVKLDETLKDRIQSLANTRKRTPHWIMREAICEYVDKAEKRESFLKEVQESWEDYQNTGLHLTGDEVIAWLKTWGTENEMDAPKCHK